MQAAGIPFGGAAKKMLGVKGANMLKGLPGGYANGPPLKPLYTAILKSLKHIDG